MNLKTVPLDATPVRREHIDGKTMTVQYIPCSHAGCKKEMTMRCTNGSLKPPELVAERGKRKGWIIDYKKGHICPEHAQKGTTVQDTKEPTISPVMRRKIFRAIDESYDEKSSRYVDGFDDKQVAAQVGTTWGWVAKIREENFGPAGPDPKVVKVMTEITELEKKVAAVEVAAMELAEKAEAYGKSIASLRSRVECLK